MTQLPSPVTRRLARSTICQYCHSATYHVTYVVYPAGIITTGVCTSCGTRGRTVLEAPRRRRNPAGVERSLPTSK